MGVFPVFGSKKMAGSDDARAEGLRCPIRACTEAAGPARRHW